MAASGIANRKDERVLAKLRMLDSQTLDWPVGNPDAEDSFGAHDLTRAMFQLCHPSLIPPRVLPDHHVLVSLRFAIDAGHCQVEVEPIIAFETRKAAHVLVEGGSVIPGFHFVQQPVAIVENDEAQDVLMKPIRQLLPGNAKPGLKPKIHPGGKLLG